MAKVRISKKLLLEDNNAAEVLRFNFAVDKGAVNKVLNRAGINLETDEDLKRFLNGINPLGIKHNVNFAELIKELQIDFDRLKTANIELY